MRSTTTSGLVSGRPRQFLLMCEKSRCSTLFHRSGRKVEGAGIFRDAVRSTATRVVDALGLKLVVVSLRATPPWGGMPLALPVNVRLHRKGDRQTTVEHAAAMIRELADSLPERRFHLCSDGTHARMAGHGLPRTHMTSRLLRDAALFDPAPPRRGRRGRPRTRAERLPTPLELAAAVRRRAWQRVTVDRRGADIDRLVHTRDVLWYPVCPRARVRLVVVRDPAGVEPDDFFFTTDLAATGRGTASRYAGRRAIEVTFRDSKPDLGGEHPQSWKHQGPARAAALSLWLLSLFWPDYLVTHPTATPGGCVPGIPARRRPASLTLWRHCVAPCGLSELRRCRAHPPRRPKSLRHPSIRWPMQHELPAHVRESTHPLHLNRGPTRAASLLSQPLWPPADGPEAIRRGASHPNGAMGMVVITTAASMRL